MLWIVVLSLACAGGVTFEVSWRRIVVPMEPYLSQWITSAAVVKKFGGEMKSIEVVRSYSRIDDLLAARKSGRVHFLFHGTRYDLDLLVYWHRDENARQPVVDKLQMLDTRGFETIWP